VVQYLVEKGADVDTKCDVGSTALLWAVLGGHLDVVRYLCEQGADKEAKDTIVGRTALLNAAWEGHLDVVLYLLEQDVDVSAKDNEGYTARSTAKVNGFHHIAELVMKYESTAWFIPQNEIVKIGGLKKGGFGMVYHAKWGDYKVVVKEIDEMVRRRFMREVNTWRELTHPNVVRFYGANHQKGRYFIVSEYASNKELVPYLKCKKARGHSLVWRKLKEVAVGLSYLHQREIVHGDLKGNNIVVSKDGIAMLTDFGLSFIESGSCSVGNMRDSLGAMAWRAPEFATKDMKLTRKSDVYSLGMCIIEAVTCAKPWRDPDASNDEIRSSLCEGKILVKKPDEMTDTQWALVEKMLAISPDDRPDLGDVLLKLGEFASAEEEAEAAAACPY